MSPQDSFIEEDDDSCPLCVEEFDLSDKNFWPCPCGYQICQFCYNNIKNNINGLCPACRRPYDEKNIEWKVVTPEEIAQFKANVQKNAKKKQEQRQKEAQKREVESMNRKHLSGLRVVQKNLVYVVGISPGIPEQEILSTLRGEKYFGQYGKIVKIVVSNKKQGDPATGGQSLGVYVTFARKEDAAKCIAAVNGSQNGDRVLRAQLGTTKYCSAYLRNETCTNKNCMFLHEPGDNDDSYSRQDLSSINSVNQERPFSSVLSGASSSRQYAHTQSLYNSNSQPQAMARDCGKDGSENGDGSALPSSASWANRGIPQRNRRDSHSTNGATSSPAVSQALPVTVEAVEELPKEPKQLKSESNCPVPSDPFNSEVKNSKHDSILTSLLSAVNSPLLSFPPPKPAGEVDNYNKFPPLFDEWGGRKRRAMREKLEESRQNTVKDLQEDLQSMPELIEEEEPESGSLQLGGEPEDREASREGVLPPSYHSQQQSSSQLPIQRFSNNGPFGPRLGPAFPKNLNNLNSINGRALTPLQQQQFLLMKTGQQSEFIDQYPPGIGSQFAQNSTPFQQSHGRQASRFNFSNDASSTSSTAKTSGNPKLMSQQSSMISSGNLSQQAGFYPTIQGPPPGLKSSGTPSNGSMFSQNLGFGNSISGALLSSIPKENNGEMLRDMIRGRGAASGSQTHDTGKREYMFPSFLHQYPSTSSNAAPTPGMASIYGPQTGAFHDFGQKQKKKGKKHRHVNTSSSGGGGLDLTDPSILQARMQHQQQNNSGVGQGLFGGQAQDDQLLPSLNDGRSSMDAVVGESTIEDYGRVFDTFSQVSRCSTPLVPPGFESPYVNSSTTSREEPISRYSNRIVPTSAPFTPRRNFSSTGTQLAHTTPYLPIQSPVISNSELVSIHQKKESKLQQSTSLKPNSLQSTSAIVQREDFPALETGKAKLFSPTTNKVALPISLVTSCKQTNPAPTPTQIPPAPYESRTTPSVSSSVISKSNQKGVDPIKSPKQAAVFPSLPATSSPVVNGQVQRNVPKTLRLTSTPKPETIPNNSTMSSSVNSLLPSHQFISQHPSLTSHVRLESPDTPTSEVVSDNASITSTSFSRANSPPPTRIGSAPVRTTTKSSQKKQRQAQKEKGRAGIEAAATVEPEVVIAPIMGRKKKQKKDRIHRSASGVTPTLSRSQSPGPGSMPGNVNESSKENQKNKERPEIVAKEKIDEPVHLKVPRKASDVQNNGKDKVQHSLFSESTSSENVKTEERPVVKPPPTPAAIFQKLISTDVIKYPNELYFLKNISSSYRNIDIPDKPDRLEISPKLIITPEEHETLLAGKPVHKISEAGNRIMLTPNGDCVRNLTEEEEEKYLEYQARLAKDAGPAIFLSTKHTGQNGFTMIGGRAVPSGSPSYFPTLNKGNGLDAVSKIQRDEALNYINQFVLPTLSSNTQLEKTLSTTATHGEMMRSTAPVDTTWRSWGSYDRAPTPVGTGDFYLSHSLNNDSMIEKFTTHFAIGDINRQSSNNATNNTTTLLSLSDAESAMQIARKEVDSLEKKLNSLIKKNRRLLLGH